jgi:hypothetical protein
VRNVEAIRYGEKGGRLSSIAPYCGMRHFQDGQHETDAGRELVEELLRTGLALSGALASLLDDLPEDAFPGEDNAAVLIEMVVGSSRSATSAAGEADCRKAVALIGAVRCCAINDLRAAAHGSSVVRHWKSRTTR